jgi:hypothetical protein
VVEHQIPEDRTSLIFIKKLAYGIGESERIRIKGSKTQLIYKIFTELIKWFASSGLFVLHLITFNPHKGVILLKFRFWILKSLLK